MRRLSIAFLAAFVLVGLLFPLSALGTEPAFYLPESNLAVRGRVVLLAIDDHSLRDRENLVLTLNKPTVRRQPVLIPERGNPNAPDSMASHFYGTVLHDKRKYRMWYYAVSLRAKPYDLKQGPICYAESSDGIQWTKPRLGQVEINGSRDNNAIKLPDQATQCAAVILDKNDPSLPYKMLYTTRTHTWVFRPATSPDGIHWTPAKDYPTERFLEMGSFFRFGDRYVVHGQGVGTDKNGTPEGRQGYASTSVDFVHWDRDYSEAFRLPEPEDTALRGLVGDYPQVHLGVGATSFGNVAVGLYGIWHNPPKAKRRKQGWYGAGLISCDLGLVVSNNGVTFREPVKGAVYISARRSFVTPVPGVNDPTILCQANGILNAGDETLIYHGRWRNATVTGQDYYAEVALATLPRDRWGSLHLAKDASLGTVWSAPITIPKGGCDIVLNADGSANVTVELAGENGNLLPAYSGANRGVVGRPKAAIGAVHWADETLLGLSGKTVRLKLGITSDKTRLYAVYVDTTKQ